MSDIMTIISTYLAYPFVRYALIVGALTSLCASLLGVILVLKRYSFIGDGLSHVAFGALAIASVLKLSNNMAVVLPITVIFAILLLCTGSNSKIKGDSAIAMVSVGALAVGYLLMNISPTSSNINGDVCGTLFGSTSILTLSISDVWISILMSLVVIAVFFIFSDKIFAVTFDEAFAESSGINVKFYNAMLSILCAVIIVLTMNLAGSLLTSALVVFPAMSAMRIFKSFKSVLICSAVISVICAILGIGFSIVFSVPVGSAVAVSDIIMFFIFCIGGKFIHIK